MKKWLQSCAALLLIVETTLVGQAVAAPTPTPPPGQGLEISPPVMELNADPGQTISSTIRIRNVSGGVLIAKARADDFGAKGEDGEPKLLLDETGATRYSLKYWVQGIQDVTLAPQELKTVSFSIAVPKNAEPGGHYGVIRFTALPPNLQGTGVALSASIGTLVLLRVSGAIKDSVSLAEFSASQKGVKKSFYEYGPVDFTVRVQNDGTVHEKVQGTITVTDTFGGKVASIAVNPKGGNVLPGSIRRFDESLAKKQLFGHYTAKLVTTYNGQKLNASIGFWVIPWKLVLLVLLGLVILIYLLRVGLRKYNQSIIERARRR